MKAFVGRASGARYPCARRRLLVEARGVCLDPEERRDILIGVDAKPSSSDVRVPEARG